MKGWVRHRGRLVAILVAALLAVPAGSARAADVSSPTLEDQRAAAGGQAAAGLSLLGGGVTCLVLGSALMRSTTPPPATTTAFGSMVVPSLLASAPSLLALGIPVTVVGVVSAAAGGAGLHDPAHLGAVRRIATAHVLALPGTIVGGAVGGIGLAVILGQAVDTGAFDPLTTMIPLSGAAAYISAVAAAVDGENAVARAYYLEDAVVTHPGSLAKMVGVPSLILGLAFLAPGLAAAVDPRTSARAVQAALLGCSAAYGVTGISMLVLSGIREHAEQDGTLLPPGGPTASARPRLDGVTPWLDPATGRGGLAVVGRW